MCIFIYLECKDILDNHRAMFESWIFAGVIEKYSYSENLDISSRSYDLGNNVKKFMERYSELSNMTTHQLYKVSTPRIDDRHFKE